MIFYARDAIYINTDSNTLLPVDTETKKKVTTTFRTCYERLKALLIVIHTVRTRDDDERYVCKHAGLRLKGACT